MIPKDLILSDNEQQQGLLWLPPLHLSRIAKEIDWLSELSISKLTHKKKSLWSDELRAAITELELDLDEQPDFNQNVFMLSLPNTFKAEAALIINDCKWESYQEVYQKYNEVSKLLSQDKIYSVFPWKNEIQPKENVIWIKI